MLLRILTIPVISTATLSLVCVVVLAGRHQADSGCVTTLDAQDALDVVGKRSSEQPMLRREPITPLVGKHDLPRSKVMLGKLLFNDVRLSGNNTLSCASCHNVSEGGDDGRPGSLGIDGQIGGLNAPTVLNSSLSIAQFWDGRAKDLYEQAPGPIHNPIEMGSNWDEVISKLNRDHDFVQEFRSVYPGGITADSIVDAIVAYEFALVTVDSPFDLYLKGDDDALSSDALDGYRLFKSAGCISCHQGQLVGGNMFQTFGVMKDFDDRFDASSELSNGRLNVTQRESDLHRFKIPSLRNVQLTAPYFHDGGTASLEEAIRIMAEFQLGESFSDKEIARIRAFLVSLTGQVEEDLR
ncbi:cytochrome-c peroxidase [Stieleria varia]|uniref:Cytochrome c551 peroxidase n=1 Tax=Stieleria varia TaxID=2528005 RepID=A0A5C6BB69_9BACT|nr:cytochrome c peroxidase [Stieleria varia]TWU07764.1 Cytochrome c551 peroxidase precursor [Stieleria varia]